MDEHVAPRIRERLLHRLGRHVHDLDRLGLLGALALRAHPLRDGHALGDGARERSALPFRIVDLCAEGLVGRIARAQRVAVHEERARAVEVDDGGIVEELHDPIAEIHRVVASCI